MKTKLQYICIILLFYSFQSFAQTIECDKIEFNLVDAIDPEYNKEGIWLNVKANYSAKNLKSDTITLKTNVRLSLLAPRRLKANLIDDNGRLHSLTSWIVQQEGSHFLEDSQLLKIVIPNQKKVHFTVSYDVLGSEVFKYKPDNLSLTAFQKRLEYFYPMDIPIKEIHVSCPDSIKQFVSYKVNKNKTVENIELAFILKNNYIEKPISVDKYNATVYIPDTLRNDSLIEQKVSTLQGNFSKLSDYLSVKHHKNATIDIILINWRDDKDRRAYGEAFSNYVLCDMHLQANDFLHEALHVLLTGEVKEPSAGQYFIKESIIEWLALFLSDKTINTAIPECSASDTISLYNAQINNYTTWDLIYSTGPSIIQQIATECGEEKMAHTIISFLEKHKDKTTDYNEFIKYSHKHLPKHLVNKLDYLIKNTYTSNTLNIADI